MWSIVRTPLFFHVGRQQSGRRETCGHRLFSFCCPADGIYPSIPQGRYIHLYNISSQAIELYFICPRRTCCYLFYFKKRREKKICYVIFLFYFLFGRSPSLGSGSLSMDERREREYHYGQHDENNRSNTSVDHEVPEIYIPQPEFLTRMPTSELRWKFSLIRIRSECFKTNKIGVILVRDRTGRTGRRLRTQKTPLCVRKRPNEAGS